MSKVFPAGAEVSIRVNNSKAVTDMHSRGGVRTMNALPYHPASQSTTPTLQYLDLVLIEYEVKVCVPTETSETVMQNKDLTKVNLWVYCT